MVEADVDRNREAISQQPAEIRPKTTENRPDVRLGAIKATDIVLATLQAAFAQDRLIDNTNPYRFVRDDPKGSKVWVCDPESRLTERDGNSMMITVTRGEYAPQELHLYNAAGSNFEDEENLSDLATTPVIIQCEAGSKVLSEVLASISYGVLKLFRRQIMEEFDIHSLKVTGISPPVKQRDVPGDPWLTVVSLRLETQEQNLMIELANHMNHETINAQLAANVKREILTLDSPPQ
jgi:hypothetical protein